MRIAVLVKQIPKFEEMELGPDGRLRRDGIELEMNPTAGAVSKAVELAAERAGSRVTVFTLGPPAADDTLREAIAWGLDRGVDIHGVHVTDAAFAGSDTLATAKGAWRCNAGRRGSVRPRAHRPQLGRRRHRAGRARARRAPRPPLPHRRALSRDRGNPRRRAVRARRRLDAGRGRAARGVVVRGAAVRADEGRPGRVGPRCRPIASAA